MHVTDVCWDTPSRGTGAAPYPWRNTFFGCPESLERLLANAFRWAVEVRFKMSRWLPQSDGAPNREVYPSANLAAIAPEQGLSSGDLALLAEDYVDGLPESA